jgi:hypothetical protein
MSADKGYTVIDQVFQRSEMTAALEALQRASIVRSKAGARHVLSVPVVRDIASDLRLTRIAGQFLDDAAIPFRATLFEKAPSANWLVVWHQDTALPLRERVDSADWGPWSSKGGVLYAQAPASALERVVALRVHLDDSTETNGPLRVLPGTHLRGVLTNDEIAQLVGEVTAVDCIASAGGVVMIRPLIVHSSSKSRADAPRRVLHIEYASSVNFGGGLELAVG